MPIYFFSRQMISKYHSQKLEKLQTRISCSFLHNDTQNLFFHKRRKTQCYSVGKFFKPKDIFKLSCAQLQCSDLTNHGCCWQWNEKIKKVRPCIINKLSLIIYESLNWCINVIGDINKRPFPGYFTHEWICEFFKSPFKQRIRN